MQALRFGEEEIHRYIGTQTPRVSLKISKVSRWFFEWEIRTRQNKTPIDNGIDDKVLIPQTVETGGSRLDDGEVEDPGTRRAERGDGGPDAEGRDLGAVQEGQAQVARHEEQAEQVHEEDGAVHGRVVGWVGRQARDHRHAQAHAEGAEEHEASSAQAVDCEGADWGAEGLPGDRGLG